MLKAPMLVQLTLNAQRHPATPAEQRIVMLDLNFHVKRCKAWRALASQTDVAMLNGLQKSCAERVIEVVNSSHCSHCALSEDSTVCFLHIASGQSALKPRVTLRENFSG